MGVGFSCWSQLLHLLESSALLILKIHLFLLCSWHNKCKTLTTKAFLNEHNGYLCVIRLRLHMIKQCFLYFHFGLCNSSKWLVKHSLSTWTDSVWTAYSCQVTKHSSLQQRALHSVCLDKCTWWITAAAFFSPLPNKSREMYSLNIIIASGENDLSWFGFSVNGCRS